MNGGSLGRSSASGERRTKSGRRDGVTDSNRPASQEDSGKAKSVSGSRLVANRSSLSGSGSAPRAVANTSTEKKVTSSKPTIPSAPTSTTRPTQAQLQNSTLPAKPDSSIKPTKLHTVPSSKGTATASTPSEQTLTPENILRPFPNPSGSAPVSSVSTPSSNISLPMAAPFKLESSGHSSQSSNPAAGYRGTGMRGVRGASRGRGGAARNPFATRQPTSISPFPEYVPSLTNGTNAAVFYPGFQSNNYPTFQPLQPVLDPYTLDPTRYWLLGQIEYYFSVDNLCRDMFLRSKVCPPNIFLRGRPR